MVDFKEQLRRQLLFLRNSCRLYDEGQVEEAIRLAVSLRVLFHDTRLSTSLLYHLGSKSIFLLSTADVFKKPQIHSLALVKPFVVIPDSRIPNFNCEMRPYLSDSSRKQSVVGQDWWRKEVVIELGGDGNLNRRDLVLAAANKDGGAHVDDQLPDTYDKARLGAGMEVEIDYKWKQTVKMPFENVHYASLRQIAYEALNSPALLQLAKI